MKFKDNSRAGFTLVEMMVTMTLSAFILASSYATIMSLAKGSESMINFSEMNTQTRQALEQFGRDARMAELVREFSDHRFTMMRKVWDRDTDSYATRFVTYEFIPSADTFSRTVREKVEFKGASVPGNIISSEILLYDVDELNFYYYRLLPDPDPTKTLAKTVSEVKHVQLEARMIRRVLNLRNTNYIISARFMMRNRDVSE